jgi:hypothetical protein
MRSAVAGTPAPENREAVQVTVILGDWMIPGGGQFGDNAPDPQALEIQIAAAEPGAL